MDKENFKKALEDEKDTTIVEHQWTKDGEEHFSYGGDFGNLDNIEKEKKKMTENLYGVFGLTILRNLYFNVQILDI